MSSEYDQKFFEDLEYTQTPSAKNIVPYLYDILKPASVIDVGCGRGFWLNGFNKCGAGEVYGVDGPWVSPDTLAFDKKLFEVRDLSKPLELDQRFDLAVNLEVAEHLPVSRAESFVSDLCRLAPAVYFGAAIPGQGGHNHYNEQWPSYWAKIFAENNFLAFDIVRKPFWNNAEVTWWYKQNAILYVHKDIVGKTSGLTEFVPTDPENLLSLIHPELFEQKVKALQPGFGRWIRGGVKAACKSVSKRLR